MNLYPFNKNIKDESEAIEKIDIGGVSLIRAAAKNYKDVLILSSKNDYDPLMKLLEEKNGETSIEDRQNFAINAFDVSSHYDTNIHGYF